MRKRFLVEESSMMTFGKKETIKTGEFDGKHVFHRLSGKEIEAIVNAKWEKQAENRQSSIYSWHGIGIEPK